jgi:hypothetical protein
MAAVYEATLARLGGNFAFVLFIAVLLAFVVEAQLTQVRNKLTYSRDGLNFVQYLQTTLGYKQPYFIL